MAHPNTFLHDLGQCLLTSVEAIFAAAAITLPTRRYVTQGIEVLDCDQLTVSLTRANPGMPGLEGSGVLQAGAMYIGTASFRVSLIRKLCGIPTDSNPIPLVADLEADALALATDAWVLFNGMRAAHTGGTLFANCADGCLSVSIGAVTPIEFSGGYGGWVCVVQVQA